MFVTAAVNCTVANSGVTVCVRMSGDSGITYSPERFSSQTDRTMPLPMYQRLAGATDASIETTTVFSPARTFPRSGTRNPV